MEFQLMSAKYWVDFKRILKDYPQIAEEFKVRIVDTEDDDSEVYITINTLEDLIKLVDIIDDSVIFNGDEIMIYDDYIE